MASRLSGVRGTTIAACTGGPGDDTGAQAVSTSARVS
jgi:hypothetical protein